MGYVQSSGMQAYLTSSIDDAQTQITQIQNNDLMISQMLANDNMTGNDQQINPDPSNPFATPPVTTKTQNKAKREAALQARDKDYQIRITQLNNHISAWQQMLDVQNKEMANATGSKSSFGNLYS